jgi:excisionase family DNA binding protein
MHLSQKLSTSLSFFTKTRRSHGAASSKTIALLRSISPRGVFPEPSDPLIEFRGPQRQVNALNAKSAVFIRFLLFRKAAMLVSIDEVAQNYLKVSRSTVYRLIEDGAIQMVHVRGCARVPLSSLERYVKRIAGGF